MRGHEIQGELQVDQPEILSAAASKRSTQPIEYLGSTRLDAVDHGRKLLAGLQVARRLDHQRMARQRLFEDSKDFRRVGRTALARQKAAIALHDAKRSGIVLVGALEALGGVFLLTGEIENQGGMQVFEDYVPVGAGELVDAIGGKPGFPRTSHGPGRQECRGQIGDRAADRLRKLATCYRILLLLDGANAEHEPRYPVGLVSLEDALREPDRLLDLAIGEHSQEGAAK